jgi:hypothetical protein
MDIFSFLKHIIFFSQSYLFLNDPKIGRILGRETNRVRFLGIDWGGESGIVIMKNGETENIACILKIGHSVCVDNFLLPQKVKPSENTPFQS